MVESFRITDLFQVLPLLQDNWSLLDGDDLKLFAFYHDSFNGEVADLNDIILL